MAKARRGRGRLFGILATGLLVAAAIAFVAWWDVRMDIPPDPETVATAVKREDGGAPPVATAIGSDDGSVAAVSPGAPAGAPLPPPAPELAEAELSADGAGDVAVEADAAPVETDTTVTRIGEPPAPSETPAAPEPSDAAQRAAQIEPQESATVAPGSDPETPEGKDENSTRPEGIAAVSPEPEGQSVAALSDPSETAPSATPTQDVTAEKSDPDADIAESTPTPSAQTISPAFDELRREEDGLTVIAGRASPGARVEVLQDGRPVATATADGSGKFAAIAFVPLDGEGHILSLTQTSDGQTLRSDEDVILAPLVAALAEDSAGADRAQVVTLQGAEQDAPFETGPSVAADGDETTGSEGPVAALDSAEADSSNVTRPMAGAEAEPPVQGSEAIPSDSKDLAEADPAPTAPGDGDESTLAEAPTAQPPADRLAASENVETEAPATSPQAVPAATGEGTQTAGTDASPGTAGQEAPAVQTAAPSPDAAPVTGGGGTELAALAPQPDPAETAPPSPTSGAILRADRNGVEVMTPASPQVMSNVALDTISYSETGDVQLAGRAQSDATQIRVYLNNNAIIDLAVDGEGRWRGDLPNVDEGIYTLRVDEMDAEGTITSRVETPFKRESAENLAAATRSGDGPVSVVTVQKGDTLWAISRERYGDGLLYVRVFEANSDDIRDPDLIYPGQVFDLPK
ncbi:MULTISPECIES: LysM peptidoglycan-binding domain-containing protein [unclassified Sulfitobacter]|nr:MULTISPECIES: LysM peptidoglycan-binding domain-containing protein [unclassified Sulfitobacter]